jgi:alkanesulfonate monooxygenase
MEMGIRSFILSGYPHKQECELFAKHVLPRIKTISLPEVFGRIPKTTPNSPLGRGERE